ncbi:hypothetical protein XM82_004564 [Salmonella enterica subsp. enterica serovar Haifa]|nr:hypothetical protein [Salmonella enterica subsp. enterica serovar Haifa]
MVVLVTTLSVSAAFAAGAGLPPGSGHRASVTSAPDWAGAMRNAMIALDKQVKPVDVRITDRGIEKAYELGNGSLLSVTRKPPVPRGSIDASAAAVSVGSDYNGHYIQFSPADQRSFLNGWSVFMLGSLGLVLGPLGAVVMGSIGSAIGPYMEQLSCASRNKSIRYTFTSDGNVTNVRCV